MGQVVRYLTSLLLIGGTSLVFSMQNNSISSQLYFKLRVPFIENKGQLDKRIKFFAKTLYGSVFITEKGKIIYTIPRIENKKVKGGVILVESLKGVSKVNILGIDKSSTIINFFIGNDKTKWKTNVNTFNMVSLGEIYEGIKLKLKVHGNNVEKIFEINPGASVENIVIEIIGAKNIKKDSKTGELIVMTKLGNVKFTKPVGYQEIDGKRVKVEVNYKVLSKNTYTFKVDQYDKNKKLIIDPLLASTYLGGNGEDDINDIVINGNDIYVVGTTTSTDLSGDLIADSFLPAGSYDVFVAKLDKDLTQLKSITYLGGSGVDYGNAIAIDSNGNIFVTGETASGDFPVSENAYQTTKKGSSDVFITKFDSNLEFLSSTYLGGDWGDVGKDIKIDNANNVYIVGTTSSDNFPGTAPGSYGGGTDAFVARLDNNLENLIGAVYVGGSSGDTGNAIVIDSNGNIFITGEASSGDFPVSEDAYKRSLSNASDAFVAKLNNNLELQAATLIGGNNIYERGYGLVIDGNNNVYVVGTTISDDFPTTDGAYRTSRIGKDDIFVSKFDNNLTQLLASTYVGTTSNDRAYDIILDSVGNIYIAGYSDEDPYIVKLNSDLSESPASITIGSKGEVHGLVLDSSQNIYIAGVVRLDIPTTEGAYQETKNSGADGFISKLTNDLSLNSIPEINSFSANPNTGYAPLTVTFNWDVSDRDNDALTCYLDVDNDGNYDYLLNDCANNTSQNHTYNVAGTYTAKLVVEDGNGGSTSQAIQINVNNPKSETETSEIIDEGGCNTSSSSIWLQYIVVLILISFKKFLKKLNRISF